MRLVFASVFALACTSSVPEKAPQQIDRGADRLLTELGRFAPFAEHRGRGGALEKRDAGFAVARYAPSPLATWTAAGALPLTIALPSTSGRATRISTAHVALEIVADVDLPLDPREGALAGSQDDLGIALVAEKDRFEEIRLAKTAERARVSRWTLKSASPIRLVDGRVMVLDGEGRAAIASEPMFAVDARGVRRDLTVTLEGNVLSATLDATGLVLPIAIDPAWTTTESPASGRMKHTATLLKDGRILVVGGVAGLDTTGIALSSAEVYDPDPAKNEWKPAGAMSVARFGHNASLLPDGKVLVTGGAPQYTADGTAIAELYDPTTNTWSTTAPLPQPRVGSFAITLSDGNVLVAGGSKNISARTAADGTAPYYVFEHATKTWKTLTPGATDPALPSLPAVVSLDKKAFVVGGLPSGCTGCSSREVLLFEESPAPKFSPKGTLRRDRLMARDYTSFAAAAYADGNDLLVIGGGDESAEKMSTGTGASIFAGDLPELWAGPSLSRLPSGDFLAVGGYVPGSAASLLPPGKMFANPYVYKVKSSEWVETSAPTARRWAQTATVLADGRVVVVGGRNKDEVIRGADIYRALTLADKCAHDGDCASGFCVDGVCCDRACIDQCEACGGGKCQPVVGSPRGLRPLCEGAGPGETCKATVCDGVTANKCVMPKEIKCADATCAGNKFTAEGACNGMGACVKPTEKDCGAFGCNEDGCRTTCVVSGECAPGAICVDGACIAGASGACNADLTASLDDAKTPTLCTPYRCVKNTGKCAQSCTTTNECAGGFICGGNNRCEPPVASDDGGGCNVGHAGNGGAAFALLLALAAITSRLRRP